METTATATEQAPKDTEDPKEAGQEVTTQQQDSDPPVPTKSCFKKYKPRHKTSVVLFGFLSSILILCAYITDQFIVYKPEETPTTLTFNTFVPYNQTQVWYGKTIDYEIEKDGKLIIGTTHEQVCDTINNTCTGYSKFVTACEACKDIDSDSRPEKCKDTCSYQNGGIVMRIFLFFALGISIITSAIIWTKGDNVKIVKYGMIAFGIQLLFLIISIWVYFGTSQTAQVYTTDIDGVGLGASAVLNICAILSTLVCIGFCAAIKGVTPNRH